MFRIFLQAFLAAVLLSAGPAVAELKTVEVTGSALSKEGAIQKALLQAVQQVHGVDINSIVSTDKMRKKENGKTQISAETNLEMELTTRGFIKSYEVLSTHCNHGECEANLAVQVPYFKAKGPKNKRRTLVVSEFGTSNHRLKKHAEKLRFQLMTLLTQSRKFALLSREDMGEYAKEAALWSSDLTTIEQKAKLGQQLGADYILFGTLQEASFKDTSYTVSMTGERVAGARVSVKADFRILYVPTMQIKWQDTAKVTMTRGASLDRAIGAAAKKIFRNTMDNIYPMKVAAISGLDVVVNQGGETLSVGERYTVYGLGEKIVDPTTGESLGRTEAAVAEIEITRVDAKLSYASVVTGDIKALKAKMLVRPKAKVISARAKPAAVRKEKAAPTGVTF